MSYKPLKVETGIDEEGLITKQPREKDMRSTAIGPQVPRHSIAISLTLAVLAYCCCSPLGIIPIVMVIFAYVKRENGKALAATRMSNYSRCMSGIVIAIGIILFILTVLYFLAYAYYVTGPDRDMSDYEYFPDDIVYPEDYNGSGGDDYYETDTDEQNWEGVIDYITDETTEEPIEYIDHIVDEGQFDGGDGE